MSEKGLRITLWASVPFNFIAAYALFVPGSAIGGLFGLPSAAPLIYAALLSFFIFGFGLVYAWLATQAEINKPVLSLGVIGKAGVFAIVAILWLTGEAPASGLVVTCVDLAFAGLWGSWLLRH